MGRSGQTYGRGYEIIFTLLQSRSGQNDPDYFESFVLRHSGRISALGKRLLVMGAALKVGRPDEVSDLLSFTLRTIPEGILLDWIASSPFRAIMTLRS
jgi:hypothetical protein